MTNSLFSQRLHSVLACGTLVVALAWCARPPAFAQERRQGPPRAQSDGQRGNPTEQASAATIPADVARLKELVPPASHPMADVALNASLLWFAGQQKNWPLANYFLGETRNRMNWEVRLNPGPKSPSGEIVDMKGTVDGINKGSMAEIKKAIDGKDSTAFEAAYKHMLEDCYSCHKNTNRPYLRPMIPAQPPYTIINFDPAADWPQ